MRNKNIGFYIGFTVFAIQTIAGDYHRDSKMKQHNNKMKALLSNSKNHQIMFNRVNDNDRAFITNPT
jgi:hypothetical protein